MNIFRKWINDQGYGCELCGAELFDYPTHRLCKDCEEGLLFNDEFWCDKCGRQTKTSGICVTCKSHLPKFTKGFSPLVYHGETSAIVNRMKNGKRRLCLYLGEKTAETFVSRIPKEEKEFLILPVPLSKVRLQARGYNQAELLAETVAERLKERGYTVTLDSVAIECRSVVRAQKKLDFTERERNAKSAYHLHKRKICEGKTVLLVDDIMTTGATGSACARLLLGAGAKAVYFLTVAATPELT